MNKEIIISDNKKLILKNCVSKKLNKVNPSELGNEITKFKKDIVRQNIKHFGPLIILNKTSDNKLMLNIELKVQACDYKKVNDNYETQAICICEPCIYAHYVGTINNLILAYNKLNIFAYEHNLTPTGLVYTIYITENTQDLEVDIFMQV